MGFSLGDTFPHIIKSGNIRWLKVKTKAQADWAELEVRKNHRELARFGCKITSGVRGIHVNNIRSRPFWELAVEKGLRGKSDKILKMAMKEVFK